MPKFVDSSSHVCSQPNQNNKKKIDEEIKSLLPKESDHLNVPKKPSAINKKNGQERQKNSLDLFKEELRKINEERENQRRKLKDNLKDTSGCQEREPNTASTTFLPSKLPTPQPLKPDPRCSTSLTLQVNTYPKHKDSHSSGSYDTGDPTTTNLYLGNINPTINENDLCDLFGKFGPLASIKIMWPRTDEEKARNRNSGFVAYMSRIDAERVLKALNGRELRGYEMKLGEYVVDLDELNPGDITSGLYGLHYKTSRQHKNHRPLSQEITTSPTFENSRRSHLYFQQHFLSSC